MKNTKWIGRKRSAYLRKLYLKMLKGKVKAFLHDKGGRRGLEDDRYLYTVIQASIDKWTYIQKRNSSFFIIVTLMHKSCFFCCFTEEEEIITEYRPIYKTKKKKKQKNIFFVNL